MLLILVEQAVKYKGIKLSKKIKWIEIGIDADVHDGEASSPAAAAARFRADILGHQMGLDGADPEGDALFMARQLIEWVSRGLSWADEPWVCVRLNGDSARGEMGPGTVDLPSWNALVAKFKSVCELHGNPGARVEIGRVLDSARLDWFQAESQGSARQARR